LTLPPFSTGCGKECGKNDVLHNAKLRILVISPKFAIICEISPFFSLPPPRESVDKFSTPLWKMKNDYFFKTKG